MPIHATKPLFPWDGLEAPPTLATVKDALRATPDGGLLAALNERRHNGCDTYPVSALWGSCSCRSSSGTPPPKLASKS